MYDNEVIGIADDISGGAAEPRSSVRLLCQRGPANTLYQAYARVHLREPPHPKPWRSPFSACHYR
jgi:hypothetical protein